MAKKRKKRVLFLILTLIFIFTFFLISFIMPIKKINFEPEYYKIELVQYFQNKNIYQIISNLNLIMKKFPEIIQIEIYPNILNMSLDIKIYDSTLIAEICDQKNCFYLDNYARLIKKSNQNNSRQRNLIKIYSELNLSENKILNEKIKNALGLIFEYANWKPLILKEIKIYSNFDLGIFSNKNQEFIFDPNKNIEEQIKKLHLFLINNYQGSRIDLRIPQKIYFR